MNDTKTSEPNPLDEMTIEEQAALFDKMTQESMARAESDPRLYRSTGEPLSRAERRSRGWRGPLPVGAKLLRLDAELTPLVEAGGSE